MLYTIFNRYNIDWFYIAYLSIKYTFTYVDDNSVKNYYKCFIFKVFRCFKLNLPKLRLVFYFNIIEL
ncbi:hypothetical protein DVK85_11835 [Flavobacterium arcticum]|uniref:Uncharacterized protein n=1 Tax=Flavobacterium arcticum TaxID=1784713 RepID=A0A345HE69_9FLAO|nr:hypothetical protein DVK85_11835 [Flavobacterium arcticum]